MLVAAFLSAPLLLAVACLLDVTRRRLWMGITAVIVFVLSWSVVLYWLDSAQPMQLALGGFAEGLAIRLLLDTFSIGMIALTATLGALLSLYAMLDSDLAEHDWLWPLWILLWGSMNLLYLSGDLFNIYVALELLGLAAVGLVVRSNTPDAISAGMRYLLVSLVGSLFYLMAVVLLYGQYGVLDVLLLAEQIQPEPASWLALALLSAGLIAKTALFPLHVWLPPAHSAVHPMVSAVLSGLVVKTGAYLLFVFWGGVFAGIITPASATLFAWLGAGAVFWGSVQALLANRLKLVVAWSTVAQLGYVFLLLYLLLVLPDPALALMAAFYFILSHALAKSVMFIAAGNIKVAAGGDGMTQIAHTLAQHPKSMTSFAIAGISLAGLPPTGGFIAKWMMLEGALSAQSWWVLAVMLVGGLLTVAYTLRVLALGMSNKAIAATNPPVHTIAPRLEFFGLGLAILVVVLGFSAGWMFAYLPMQKVL